MEYVFGLDRVPEEKVPYIGGKANSLSLMLRHLKVNVPYGYVLCADAVKDGVLLAEAEKEIDEMLKELDGSKTYAVRSSALNEDGENASFAGQYETVTNVPVAEIKNAIAEVLQSANNSRVKEYTKAFDAGLQGEEVCSKQAKPQGIAVVIQVFIQPEFAGVVFTSDTITGSNTVMIGNYVHGEGENLVSGAANAESFRIDKRKYQFTGSQEMQPYGKKLYQYCSDIERYYGMPMDIEWAIAGGKLYILQARAITTLRRCKLETYEVNGSLSGNKLLTRTNVGEIFMKPISPMTFSALEKINAFLGLPEWLDNIYGQPFMNITAMCSLLVGLGMSEEKAYENIKDLAGNIPEDITIPLSMFDRKAFLGNLKNILFPKYKCKLSKAEKVALMENVPQICRDLMQEIRELNSNEALDRYWSERLIPLLNDGLASVLAVSGTKMGPLFTVREKIAKVAGRDMANRLCGGCVGVVESLKPLLLLEDVANGLISKEEYVKTCGHRCVNEMELMEPRPYEDPNFPDARIEDYKENGVSVRKMQEATALEYEAALKEFMEQNPTKKKWINKQIARFQEANRAREDVRSKGVMMFGVFREYILRIGEVNGLGEDVFMLMVDELFQVLRGEIKVAELISARKETYEKYLEYPTFPSVILGRFLPDEWMKKPNRRTDFFCESYSVKEDKNHGEAQTVSGFPGAAGVIEGVVKVITDINDMDQIEKGDILVTTATNIGWTIVFPKVAAVITDIGAPLSHAAIVAREFGIPAVVGCGNATIMLKTGDRVRVDGAKGKVYITI